MKIDLPEKRYYGIGEVAKAFSVNNSLIRFWEKEFQEIQPKKKQSGTRKYTPENVLNDVVSNLSLKRIGETEETLKSLFEQWLIVEFSDVSFKEFTEKFLKKYDLKYLN